MPNLSAQPTQLIGREGDIAAARALLLQPPVRLVTLLGHGGVGKTRLAIAVAESAARTYTGEIVFVDLAPLTDTRQVIAQIASAIGLRDTSDQATLTRLTHALHDRPALLVLDNFEHVLSAVPALVELLRECPQLKVLVTSRIPLRTQWERQFPVAPLALPGLHPLPAWTKLTDYASVRLFVERAQLVQPDFRLTERNAETIASICNALDGLPLAIELAAARVKSLSLAAIWGWLSQDSTRLPLHLLATTQYDLPTRHLSLRAAIDWSYRLLTLEEQRVVRLLSVFASDFSLSAAESLVSSTREDEMPRHLVAHPAERPQIFDTIASLVDKNLLTRRTAPESDGRTEAAEARYYMLQTIREFGLERLTEEGELQGARQRHAHLFTELAEAAEREQNGPNETLWFNRLAREWSNLRAALRWLLENDPETGLRLAGSLDRFWEAHDEQGEGGQWLEALLERAGDARAEIRAKALSAAGTMAWRRSDCQLALERHQQSLELYQACGDQHGCALALNNVGVQYGNLDSAPLAIACYEQSIALARTIGDLQAETFALVNLGILALEAHDLPRARSLLEEGLGCARRLGSQRGIVSALNNLGEVSLGLGDIQAADDFQRECVRRSYASDLKTELAYGLEGLAGICKERGLLQKGARLFGAADAIREMVKAPPHPSYVQAYYDPTRRALETGLGADAFAAAWEAGRAASLADNVAEALANDTQASVAPDIGDSRRSEPNGLSRRERQVAALIAQGMSNRDIAEALVITEGTAANHVAHIMDKLDCHSRAQIAAWAVTHDLRTPESAT